MIKGQIYRGLIYAGATQLTCTIRVEQTAPMQLTVRAGTFTHTNGRTWTLSEDAVFDLVSHPDYPTECQIEIGDIAGSADVWCGTRLLDGIEEMERPLYWNTGHVLAFPFVIPAGCTDLKGVDIFFLLVRPGFPDEATMEQLGIKIENGVMRQGGIV